MKLFPVAFFVLSLTLFACGSNTQQKAKIHSIKGKLEFLPQYLSEEMFKDPAVMDKDSLETDKALEMFGQLIKYGDINAYGYCEPEDKERADSLLHSPAMVRLFQKDLGFFWSKEVDSKDSRLLLYAVQVPPKDLRITSKDVLSAELERNENQARDVINISLTPTGAKKFAAMSSENIGRYIAVVYNGNLVSAPVVNEPIRGGKIQIAGFSKKEVEEFLGLEE